jgi:chromosome segregation ATPase
MVQTNLPTKSDYEKAVNELNQLNEDIFYSDFKEKVNSLESRSQELLEQAVSTVGSVSNEIAAFTRDLTVSAESNRKFLEQNEAFFTLTKEDLAKTEEQLASHITALLAMDNRLQQLQQSYKEMFHKHSESINTVLVVREEALINKVAYQIEGSTLKQLEQLESYKIEIQHLQEQVESMSKQHKDKLHSLSDQMLSKLDLAKAEKRSALKMNILLGVVVVEAILIGIKFFM